MMGTGHQGGSYTTPVADELDFYVLVRNKYFATTDLGTLSTTLQTQASQSVTKDANGQETVGIQDRSGKTLMSARAGTDQVVNNTVTLGGPANPDMNVWYFRLMGTGGAVTVTGGTFTLYDMGSESALGSFSSGNTLPGGYYKLVNTGSAALTLNYSNSYSDISYNFYNQLGKLVATVAPEGVKKLYGIGGNGLSNYTSRTAIPFISIYTYDVQGRMVNSQTPDEGAYTNGQYTGGVHTYVYRKDGKIRFSQTPAQANMLPLPAYSYTNYDASGRAIETGQYQPDNTGIPFNGSAMAAILETPAPGGGLTTGTKTDVSITQYDLPDASYGAPLTTNYNQDPVNLGGAVSVRFKYSTINSSGSTLQSATWYNYDEEGKPVWTIRYINGLGYKTTDFSYDPMGRLIKKVYQAGTTETFVHYYDYDPVTSQLWHIFTNTVDNPSTRILQATYYYYLHGSLKRVELAGTLQGTDYTYTLQGTTKAINNSNKGTAMDPGADGTNGFATDAFGEVLDYYSGDYTNARTGIASINGVNTASITGTTIPDSYVGNIKAMSWYSEKPTSVPNVTDAAVANVFQYDQKYQFTENTWGTSLSFGTGQTGFTPTSDYKERIGNVAAGAPAYDENGNIQSLYRTDLNGNPLDQFTYNYNPNTNQLSSVTEAGGQTYATFGYDANGQMISEVIGDASEPSSYITYDVTGKVTGVYNDAAYQYPRVQFVYDELGRRIKKLDYNISTNQLIEVTYYTGEVLYTQMVNNGTYEPAVAWEYEINGAGNRLGVYNATSQIYAYQLTDHLGNVRAVIAQSGTTYQVRMYNDFYPYGKVISGGTEDYRYDYQGQNSEKDGETGWNSFELRMYNSRLGRWFQPDPKGQFFSPYVGMGNNPVSGVDKDGGFLGTLIGAVLGGAIEGTDNWLNGKSFWEGAERGAIRGAIVGAVVDAAYTGGASLAVAGALGGFYSELADQAFFGDGHVHVKRLIVSTLTGGVGGMFMEAAAPVSRWVAGKLIKASIQVPEGYSAIGMGDEGEKIYEANMAAAQDGAVPAPDPGVTPITTLTTSSKMTIPRVVYTISLPDATLYKFGVSDPELERAYQSLDAAPPGSTMTISNVMPKNDAHLMEKYLRSLQFNSTGQWQLPGMKVPYPIDFTTGKPIGPQ